jgi:hypothetical protein
VRSTGGSAVDVASAATRWDVFEGVVRSTWRQLEDDPLQPGGSVTRSTAPIRRRSRPWTVRPPSGELIPDDVLVLAVKSQDTAGAVRQWAAAPVAGRRRGR